MSDEYFCNQCGRFWTDPGHRPDPMCQMEKTFKETCLELDKSRAQVAALQERVKELEADLNSERQISAEVVELMEKNETLTADLARVTGALDKWEEAHKAIAEIHGVDPTTWPTHGNKPLAVTALIQLRVNDWRRAMDERDAALQNPEGVWRGRWAQEAMNAGELRRELNEVRVNGEVASKHWNSRAELAELALTAEREKNATLTKEFEVERGKWQAEIVNAYAKALETVDAERARAKGMEAVIEEAGKLQDLWIQTKVGLGPLELNLHQALGRFYALSPSPAKDFRTEVAPPKESTRVPKEGNPACLPSASESAPPPAVEKPINWCCAYHKSEGEGRCSFAPLGPAVAPVESLTDDEGGL